MHSEVYCNCQLALIFNNLRRPTAFRIGIGVKQNFNYNGVLVFSVFFIVVLITNAMLI